jgi:hypothetical protein
MRWSSEPRRTLAGEESWAASLSRLRIACYRVINDDDTIQTQILSIHFMNKMF